LKHDFIEFWENARRRRPEKFRHQFYIFLTCLGISIFFWLLVQLSKEYSYNVEYHLHYKQVPSSLHLIYSSDSVITVTIKVQGFEFFSEHFLKGRHRTFDVSLRGIKIKPYDNQFAGFLLTHNISSAIAAESKYPLDIFSTTPDTLFFSFEKKTLKKFPSIKASTITVSQPDSKNDPGRKRIDSIHPLSPASHQKKITRHKNR
jgi:hypothetical protein